MPTSEQNVVTRASVIDPPSATKALPPPELQHRVTDTVEPGVFLANGRQSAGDLEVSLASAGRSLDSFDRILDFGCGPARVLLWLEELAARAELHGTDIDARSIDWVQSNLPYVTAAVNRPKPPLDYPDGYFDLIYSHSVFTHIDAEYQDLWLAELQRVTRPGGLVLASVHGETAFNRAVEDVQRIGQDPSGWATTLGEDGILFIANDAWVGGPFPDFYHSTFHLPWYVFAHWGEYFQVRSYLARGSLGYQDYVLLERPADGSAPPAPLVQRRPAASPSELPTAGPPATPASESGGALARVVTLLEAGHEPDMSGRSATGRGVRRVVARALRGPLQRQGDFNRAITDALREEKAAREGADQSIRDRLPSADAPPNALDPLAAAILKRQGERINRLENDLRAGLNGQPGSGPRAPAGDSESP